MLKSWTVPIGWFVFHWFTFKNVFQGSIEKLSALKTKVFSVCFYFYFFHFMLKVQQVASKMFIAEIAYKKSEELQFLKRPKLGLGCCFVRIKLLLECNEKIDISPLNAWSIESLKKLLFVMNKLHFCCPLSNRIILTSYTYFRSFNLHT